ncbi:MAG: shikimate dehydrogenase [Bacteroidales bacterium]|nr:shikimate dehydrogenase [Bacteroidales bacterium]
MNPERYGLLGYPLGHSFSAGYFAEKFRREHIAARYDNFEFEHIEEAVNHLRAMKNLRGFNVTIPHKQAIMPYLDELSEDARRIGAVNVVCVRTDPTGRVCWTGCNSDVIGFSRSIRPLLQSGLHTRALVLGTGGASKAVVYGLQQLGIQPQLVSRTEGAGRLSYAQLTEAVIRDHKVIVNCSPVGMYPHTDACPSLPYHLLTPHHLLYDLVYNPLQTRFMELGKQQGAVVKNGLEMLHLQAEAAWQMWNS